MNSFGYLALGVITLAVVVSVVAAIWLTQPAHYQFVPDRSSDVERYRVRTPAGPATVTRVLDDKGRGFLIETRFRGQWGHQMLVVGPSPVIARETLHRLVETHQGGGAT